MKMTRQEKNIRTLLSEKPGQLRCKHKMFYNYLTRITESLLDFNVSKIAVIRELIVPYHSMVSNETQMFQ